MHVELVCFVFVKSENQSAFLFGSRELCAEKENPRCLGGLQCASGHVVICCGGCLFGSVHLNTEAENFLRCQPKRLCFKTEKKKMAEHLLLSGLKCHVDASKLMNQWQ